MTAKPEALLVIDIQNGFMEHGSERVVGPVASLVRAWPPGHLYYLKYRNHPGSLYERHLDWQDCMTAGQADLVPEIYVGNAPVFEHFGYAPPPELLAALKKYKSVGLCGVDTDACIMAAAFALWEAEIRPFVLEHYSASSGGPHFHAAALDLIRRQFGTGAILQGEIA